MKSEVWKFDAGAIGLTSYRQSGLVWRCMMLRPFPLSSKRLALVKRLTKPLIQLSNYQKATNRSTLATVYPSTHQKNHGKHPTTRSWFPTCFWHSDSPMDNDVEYIDDTRTGLDECQQSIPQNSTQLCQAFPLVTFNFDSLIMTDFQLTSPHPKETTKMATNRWPMALFQQHWLVQKGKRHYV